MSSRVIRGEAREVLMGMPEASVDMCMTSPPYWGLRKYSGEPQIWDSVDGCNHEWGEYDVSLLHENRDGLTGSTIGNTARREGKHGLEVGSAGFCLKCGAWRGQLGLEPDPDSYISHLMLIFDEVWRVLKPTSSLFVNLADSYSGSGSGGGGNQKGNESGDVWFDNRPTTNLRGIPAKSLIGIPARFQLAMIERGWVNRNFLAWYKRSCMPSSARDRFTMDWEPIFFFTKQQDYYFETQFEPHVAGIHPRGGQKKGITTDFKDSSQAAKKGGWNELPTTANPQGRLKRCVWDISTEPMSIQCCAKCYHVYDKKRYERLLLREIDNPDKKSKEKKIKVKICSECDANDWVSHYAAYPTELCRTPILATCPEFICDKCNQPRRKMYEVIGHEVTEAMKIAGCRENGTYAGQDLSDYKSGMAQSPSDSKRRILKSMSEIKDFHYSTCSCPEPRTYHPGVVLDCFSGTGSTGVMAKLLGRDFVGIDTSEAYVAMSNYRLLSTAVQGKLE